MVLFSSFLSGILIIFGSFLIFPKFVNPIRKFFWAKSGKYLPKFSLAISSFILVFSSILVFPNSNSQIAKKAEVFGVNSSQSQSGQFSSSNSNFSSSFSSSASLSVQESSQNSEKLENLAKSTELSVKSTDKVENSSQNSIETAKFVQNSQNSDKKLYEVLEVVDGDTIKISEIGTLRLIGIDTPETKDPRKVVQCFGKEASNRATELLANKKVYLEFDETHSKLDKYQRTLAYVFREDGYFYNLEMVKNGFAHSYKQYPHPKLDEFNSAENSARSGKIGFWADNTCGGNTEQGVGGEVAKAPVSPTGGTQTKPKETIQTPKAETIKPAAGNFDSNGDGKVTCKDFKGQVTDQSILAQYPKLDGNSDGVGCENN